MRFQNIRQNKESGEGPQTADRQDASKGKWNFGPEDCDKGLRIDGKENIVLKITGLLTAHKFYREELEHEIKKTI